MTTRTFKYRIYPNEEQATTISRFFGCARKVYNLLLAWYSDTYAKCKSEGVPMPKTPGYSYFKNMEEYSYLKECDSIALASATLHFNASIDAFFKSRKSERKGEKVGFPRFKKKDVSKDTYSTFNNNGTVKLSDDEKRIKLPKVGWIKIVLHRPFDGRIKTITVSRSKSGNYHVALTVETNREDKPIVNKKHHVFNPSVVGLDLSMSDFAVSSETSDAAKPKYIRLYRKYEKKLARLQREVSRKEMVGTGEYFINKHGKEQEIKRRSNNREKARVRYAKYAEHVANIRREYLIQTALWFVRKYDVVVLEDIDLQAMSRTLKLGKSTMDLGFGEFRSWLEWEASKYDCYIHYVDKWFASSKLCNNCGTKYKELTLSEREWTCPQCGHHHNRDVNAALNLRDEFLRRYSTVGATGINACGDGTSTLRETVGRVLSVKQEVHA